MNRLSTWFAGVKAKLVTQYALLRRHYIVEQYVRAGALFGEALSAAYTGECVNLAGTHERWAKFEMLYAALGYRTLAAADFLEYGGYGRAVDDLVWVAREADEEPILHAEKFMEDYSQGILPMLEVPHDDDSLPRICRSQNQPGNKKSGKKGTSCGCNEEKTE